MAPLGKVREDIAECLAAGRDVALAEFGELCARTPGWNWHVTEPSHGAPTRINGIDISCVIDAVVIETIVRLEHPDRAAAKARPWWKFWR